MRFGLPSPDKCLGLKIGQYVWIGINGEKRPYVPISSIDQSGTVDFLIKDMSTVNPYSFTKKVISLSVRMS